MTSTAIADRSFLFRTGVLCAQVLRLLRNGISFTEREGGRIAGADRLLTRMVEVKRYLDDRRVKPSDEAISEYIAIREIMVANAWRFPDSSMSGVEKLLVPLRGLLKGETISVEDLDAARAFFTAMSGLMLSACQDREPDDDD